MKRSFLFFGLLLLSIVSYAQSIADALRYAQQDPTGTARFAGAGGAFTALGADYGAITVNPAGAAMFRTDEFVLSGAMRFHESHTTLGGAAESWREKRSHFGLDAIGLVMHRNPRRSKWATSNLILGYNRTANFNRKYYYEGKAPGSIVSSYLQDYYTSGDYNDFGSGMAADANAIYQAPNGKLTTDFEGLPDASILHKQFISERGGGGELHFGWAGNYNERLMVGMTVGVPLMTYTLNSTYSEEDPDRNIEYFNALTLNETVRSELSGFNFKLGMIYRVSQAFRIGGAFHTPSFLNINDSFKSDFSYDYTDGAGNSVKTATSPDGLFDYKLNTPFKTSVGAAYLFGNRGFISGDVEVVDYANSVFNLTALGNGNAPLERELNRDIERQYSQTVNVKLGGEITHQELRFRAGLQHFANPNTTGGKSRMIYSAGIGYRGDDFYLDFAFRVINTQSKISPYDLGTRSLVAKSDARNQDCILTLGFKF